MDNKRRLQIYNYASKLNEALELSFPCDPKEAVKKLQGTIVDSKNFGIENTGENSFIIHLDSFGNRASRIAEAIGHLVLHTGYLVESDKWNNTKMYIKPNIDECYDAYEFASGFLLPIQKFRQISGKYLFDGAYKIGGIAEEMGVSVSRVSLYGKRLGMFVWD